MQLAGARPVGDAIGIKTIERVCDVYRCQYFPGLIKLIADRPKRSNNCGPLGYGQGSGTVSHAISLSRYTGKIPICS